MPKTILVVDDTRETVEIIRRVLERDGYEVEVAFDGKEGLAKALAVHPDLILLDIMMPVMDGITMNRHLKDNPATASIPVIILSARGGMSPVLEGDPKAGVNAYLVKPASPLELMGQIEEVLKKQRP